MGKDGGHSPVLVMRPEKKLFKDTKVKIGFHASNTIEKHFCIINTYNKNVTLTTTVVPTEWNINFAPKPMQANRNTS
jgi:hypothetical protein